MFARFWNSQWRNTITRPPKFARKLSRSIWWRLGIELDRWLNTWSLHVRALVEFVNTCLFETRPFENSFVQIWTRSAICTGWLYLYDVFFSYRLFSVMLDLLVHCNFLDAVLLLLVRRYWITNTRNGSVDPARPAPDLSFPGEYNNVTSPLRNMKRVGPSLSRTAIFLYEDITIQTAIDVAATTVIPTYVGISRLLLNARPTYGCQSLA